MGSDAELSDSDSGSEGYAQVDGTQTSGPAAPGHSKGGAKPSSSKGGKKATTKDGSPANSDDEGETETRNNDGAGVSKGGVKGKEEDDEEEENMDMEFGKYHTVDPDKMRAVLATFTPEQMSRYECYRRSGFQRANMRRLLQSVSGGQVSVPMTIVISGIAKMFVGELVEIGRIVMTERNETGPIRPCHIREAYRRLKLEGKVPLRGRPRLFR